MNKLAAGILIWLITGGCWNGEAVQEGASISPTVQASAPAASTPTATPAVAAPKPRAEQPAHKLTPAQARAEIGAVADHAIEALKNKDWKTLSGMAHPDKGIRFSPYSFVDTEHDLVFKADQLVKLMDDPQALVWGSFDGSGEPIKLSFQEYYSRFLYNHDYAAAEKTGYNEMLGKGNTVNNIHEVYPDGISVDYYFSGFNPEYAGMDWASLILIFEESGGSWYLTGMVRNQWTI